jgi:hypothetical protein
VISSKALLVSMLIRARLYHITSSWDKVEGEVSLDVLRALQSINLGLHKTIQLRRSLYCMLLAARSLPRCLASRVSFPSPSRARIVNLHSLALLRLFITQQSSSVNFRAIHCIHTSTTSLFASMATSTGKKRKLSSPDEPSSSTSPPPPPTGERKKTKGESVASLAPRQVSRLSDEHPVWPAPASTIAKASTFIKRAASSGESILLIPDKDADGLSAGMIMKRTLIHLGAKPELIAEHHIPSGKNPASKSQQEVLEKYDARWIIVLDQGSPAGPPLVKGAEKGWASDEEGAVRTMVLDHHFVTDLDKEGPQGSLLLNACKSRSTTWRSLERVAIFRSM